MIMIAVGCFLAVYIIVMINVLLLFVSAYMDTGSLYFVYHFPQHTRFSRQQRSTIALRRLRIITFLVCFGVEETPSIMIFQVNPNVLRLAKNFMAAGSVHAGSSVA